MTELQSTMEKCRCGAVSATSRRYEDAMPVSVYGLKCRGCQYQAVLTGEDSLSSLDFILESIQDLICPKCKRKNIAFLTKKPEEGEHLSPTQMRMAFTGFGLPDEQRVTLELIEELFTEVGVSRVETSLSPAKRVLIRSFVFNDGRVVYLGPSGFGVAAFKVTTGEADASSDIHQAQESP
jgi:hypothetical protein